MSGTADTITPMKQNNREIFTWDFTKRNAQVGATIAGTPAIATPPQVAASAPVVDLTNELVQTFITSGTAEGSYNLACTIINSAGETITREFALLVEG